VGTSKSNAPSAQLCGVGSTDEEILRQLAYLQGLAALKGLVGFGPAPAQIVAGKLPSGAPSGANDKAGKSVPPKEPTKGPKASGREKPVSEEQGEAGSEPPVVPEEGPSKATLKRKLQRARKAARNAAKLPNPSSVEPTVPADPIPSTTDEVPVVVATGAKTTEIGSAAPAVDFVGVVAAPAGGPRETVSPHLLRTNPPLPGGEGRARGGADVDTSPPRVGPAVLPDGGGLSVGSESVSLQSSASVVPIAVQAVRGIEPQLYFPKRECELGQRCHDPLCAAKRPAP